MKTYLNFGCGRRFVQSWKNIDLHAGDGVIRHRLPEPFPFSSESFEVVYSSHVLEHFTREEAQRVIAECYRILRPGGILRLVVPDLEDVTREYLRILERVKQEPVAGPLYEWIAIELLDQIVREEPGGEMGKFLDRALGDREYVMARIGASAAGVGESPSYQKRLRGTLRLGAVKFMARGIEEVYEMAMAAILRCLPGSEFRSWRVGKFRLRGEVHRWMYDEYSLGSVLRQRGFTEIQRQNPGTSSIDNWREFSLDNEPDGTVYRPHSLILEGRRPR